jgi:hypothetical protein
MIAYITAVIAALVAFIALLQWKTARDKVLLDLFDKRYAIYEDLRIVMSEYDRRGTLELEKIFGKFGRAQARAKFLFGEEVNAYLEQCQLDLIGASNDARRGNSVSPIPEAAEDPVLMRMNRLANFFAVLDRLVSPYMSHRQKALGNPLA